MWQAAQALWITILRFTGDIAEPRYNTADRDNVSVMSKVTATLGRNFIRSKEFQEAQLMGIDPVSTVCILYSMSRHENFCLWLNYWIISLFIILHYIQMRALNLSMTRGNIWLFCRNPEASVTSWSPWLWSERISWARTFDEGSRTMSTRQIRTSRGWRHDLPPTWRNFTSSSGMASSGQNSGG